MPEKAKPCCARIDGKLVGLRNDLRRAANRAARYSQQGRSTKNTLADIETIRERIQMSEDYRDDHAAMHAGEENP